MAIEQASSHRQILRSSSIVGAAAIINVAVGLLKTKVVALILGPAGLGVIVLLQNLMQTIASAASLGLGQAGTRQVAEAHAADDEAKIALVRRSLLIGTTVLALVSGAVVWCAGDLLADWLAPGKQAGWQVRWLAIGVALTVATQAQTALLMGFRRVGDMARVSTASVFVSAVVGIAAVWIWSWNGILAFVLIQVVATFGIGHVYVARLDSAPRVPIDAAAVRQQLTVMFAFGGALTVAAICVNVGQLVGRTLIQQELGVAAVGLFQASWLISVTYLGFVLQAMGTDFYPRIVAANQDRALLVRLVNEQIEVAMLLAAPVLLAMLGCAPWLMHILYARAFDPAVPLLQWQVLADVLKVASWPLGYLLLACNASRIYMIAEIATIGVMILVLWVLLPVLGVTASGVAVLAMYLFYLPLVFGVAVARTRFRWTRVNLLLIGGTFAACTIVFATSHMMPIAGGILGLLLAGGAGTVCLVRLRDSLPSPILRIVRRMIPNYAH